MNVGAETSKRFVTNVFGTAAGFLGTVVFTRQIGFDGIGTYAIFFSLQMVAGSLISFGLFPTVTKRVSEGENEARQFASGALILLTGVGVVSIGAFILGDLINELVGTETASFVPLAVLSWGLFRLSGAFLEGKQRVALVGAIENSRHIIIVPIQLVFVFAGFDVVGLICGLILGQFVTFLISYIGFARVIPAQPSFELFRDFVHYSKYAYVQSVAGQLFKQADYILLGQFVGAGPTGVYKNAFRITEASMLFSSALSRVSFPQFSALTEQGNDERVKRLLAGVFTYAGLFAIPMISGGAVIGNDLMITIYANNPGVSVLPIIGVVGIGNVLLPLLSIANLINGYREGIENFFLGVGRPRIYAASGLLLVGTYSVSAVPLILSYGSFGVAVATVLAFGVSVGSMLVYLDQKVPRAAVRDISTQIVSAVLMTVIVYAAKVQLGTALGLWRLVLLLSVGGTTYFVFLLALSKRIRGDAVNVLLDLHNEFIM